MYVFDGSLCTAMTLGFGHLHVPSAKTRVAWDAASAGMDKIKIGMDLVRERAKSFCGRIDKFENDGTQKMCAPEFLYSEIEICIKIDFYIGGVYCVT